MDSNANTTSSAEWYQEILLANGKSDKIKKVIVQESGAKGDGLASLTQGVIIEFESGRKPLHLFVKIHTDNPSHEEFLSELLAFEKEAQFFMDYLPAAQKLCDKNGMSHLLDMYPKCYYGDQNIIVLENLVLERGYELHARDKRHDFDTAIHVLNSLAKHHAISFAMIGELGIDKLFQKFPSFKHDGWLSSKLNNMLDNLFENALKTTIQIVENHLQNSRKELVQKLKAFQGKAMQLNMESMKDREDDKLHVLVHGDFKGNNMMFRKNPQNSGQLQQKIIDFQVICYKTPAFDLIYYLYTSVDTKTRQSRLNDLLESYLATFNITCADLGYPANMPYEDLLSQFKRKVDMGLFYGLTLIGPGMSLVKTNEDIDVSQMNMDEYANLFAKGLQDWIDQHPEEGKEMAKEIVSLVKEHETLSKT